MSKQPTTSPWGEVQECETLLDGVYLVSTAGHGGLRLDKEWNKRVPAPLRISSGWYEEDVEICIPIATVPEILEVWLPTTKQGREDLQAVVEQTVKDYFPDKWATATKTTLTADDSRTVAEREWYERFKDHFVVTSALSVQGTGLVVVYATRGGDRSPAAEKSARWFVVPYEMYRSGDRRHPLGKFGGWFVVDPSVDKEYIPERPGMSIYDIEKAIADHHEQEVSG